MAQSAPHPAPLAEFPRLTRRFTQEHVNAYGALNEDRNLIHYDAEFARQAGFSAPLVHGAMVAALLGDACRDYFGAGWAAGGTLSVKFIRPVLVGQAVTTGGRPHPEADAAAGRFLRLEVWCRNEAGEDVLVGEAGGVPAA
jgi:acyl dehydratase